jgi:DNA-binding NarL/FixJ family response regulator
MSISVLLADDQELVRAGFRALIDSQADMTVVGDAADGRQAVSEARRLNPHVVLMDIRMPDMGGIEATLLLRAPEADRPKVIMLTTFDADEYVYQALGAGASGFLLKDGPAEDLFRAIRVVASGQSLLAPAVTTKVIRQFATQRRSTPNPKLKDLTPRELEVLRLVAAGLSNSEIAQALFIGEGTAKTHVARILMKLGLRDRVQAVIAAYESGLVHGSGASC